jgi:hypothetical protein
LLRGFNATGRAVLFRLDANPPCALPFFFLAIHFVVLRHAVITYFGSIYGNFRLNTKERCS